MKRVIFWISVIILISLIIGFTRDDNKILENKKTYVMHYDQITYDLETYMNDVFLDNIFFYDRMQFINFDTTVLQESIQGLVIKLNHYAGVIEKLNKTIDDHYIIKYSEEIRGSLLGISQSLNQYRKLKMVNSIAPNVTTIYKDTYILMDTIHEDLLNMSLNKDKMNKHVNGLRDYQLRPTLYASIKKLEQKNKMRILYTYLYTACYIGSYDDYTGLHTNPKIPWFFELNDGAHVVYELNVNIMKHIQEFCLEYIDMNSAIRSMDEQVSVYAKLITKVLDGVDNYLQARELFPQEYFSSYDFLQDQHMKYERKNIVFFDFDYQSTKFSKLKNAYFQVKFITDRSPLNLLMYDKEELPDNYDVIPFD